MRCSHHGICYQFTRYFDLKLMMSHSKKQLIQQSSSSYFILQHNISGPSVWNNSPTALRMSDCSLTTFKTEIKTSLFIRYIVYRQLHFLTAGQRICGLLGGFSALQIALIIIIIIIIKQIKIAVEYKNMPEGCQRSKRSLNWPPILYNNINTNDKRKKEVTSHL